MASLDSALNIIGAERQGEDLKFLANGESVTESEFRKLADMADGSPGLVVPDSSGVERIRADYSASAVIKGIWPRLSHSSASETTLTPDSADSPKLRQCSSTTRQANRSALSRSA
jgi:hypothetical protein